VHSLVVHPGGGLTRTSRPRRRPSGSRVASHGAGRAAGGRLHRGGRSPVHARGGRGSCTGSPTMASTRSCSGGWSDAAAGRALCERVVAHLPEPV